MGDLVVIDKRKRLASPESSEGFHPEGRISGQDVALPGDDGYITERVAVPREAFERFARGEDRKPQPIPEEVKRRAQRAWADQAAGTLWWSAQAAGQRGKPALAERILAKRDELRAQVAESLGEIWA